MIDCEECIAYAHLVHARGEIKLEDINKLAIDRHVLKGCDSPMDIINGVVEGSIPVTVKKMHRFAVKCVDCGEEIFMYSQGKFCVEVTSD